MTNIKNTAGKSATWWRSGEPAKWRHSLHLWTKMAGALQVHSSDCWWQLLHLVVLFVVLCLVGFRSTTDDDMIPSCVVVSPIKGVPSRVSISARFSGGQLWTNNELICLSHKKMPAYKMGLYVKLYNLRSRFIGSPFGKCLSICKTAKTFKSSSALRKLGFVREVNI